MNAKSADFPFIITYILDPLASMDCWLDFMRYLSFAMSLTRCLHSSLEKAFIWSQPPWMSALPTTAAFRDYGSGAGGGRTGGGSNGGASLRLGTNQFRPHVRMRQPRVQIA